VPRRALLERENRGHRTCSGTGTSVGRFKLQRLAGLACDVGRVSLFRQQLTFQCNADNDPCHESMT
jgi:hypothetical protein